MTGNQMVGEFGDDRGRRNLIKVMPKVCIVEN